MHISEKVSLIGRWPRRIWHDLKVIYPVRIGVGHHNELRWRFYRCHSLHTAVCGNNGTGIQVHVNGDAHSAHLTRRLDVIASIGSACVETVAEEFAVSRIHTIANQKPLTQFIAEVCVNLFCISNQPRRVSRPLASRIFSRAVKNVLIAIQVFAQSHRPGLDISPYGPITTGSRIAIKIAMMAMTTRSSTSVNPRSKVPTFFIANSFRIRRPRMFSPSSEMNFGRPQPAVLHNKILPQNNLSTTTIPPRRSFPALSPHSHNAPHSHGLRHASPASPLTFHVSR